MSKVLTDFAKAVLKDRMEEKGYKRIGTAWYKTVPDVLLAVELEPLPFRSFRINFGIVPFSSYYGYYPNITVRDIQLIHWKNHPKDYFDRFSARFSAYFLPPVDAIDSLADANRYPFCYAFWKDAVEEIVLPILSSVDDLDSADKAIRSFNEKYNHVSYYLYDIGMLIKLGKVKEAQDVIDRFIDARTDIRAWIIKDNKYIENDAEESWKKWEKGDTRVMRDIILWQWLIQTNDVDRMNVLISESETAALKWAKAKKLLTM
ncbi:MAG: hypothetical protein Q4B07_01385 [Clostridia bacterium]|nr:hypothetical protein [Clostridia bacterium]